MVHPVLVESNDALLETLANCPELTTFLRFNVGRYRFYEMRPEHVLASAKSLRERVDSSYVIPKILENLTAARYLSSDFSGFEEEYAIFYGYANLMSDSEESLGCEEFSNRRQALFDDLMELELKTEGKELVRITDSDRQVVSPRRIIDCSSLSWSQFTVRGFNEKGDTRKVQRRMEKTACIADGLVTAVTSCYERLDSLHRSLVYRLTFSTNIT